MNSNDILIANTDDLRSDMNYLEKTLLKGHRIDPNLYEESADFVIQPAEEFLPD